MVKNDSHGLEYKVSMLVFTIQVQNQFPMDHLGFVAKSVDVCWATQIWECERALFVERKNCSLGYIGSERTKSIL